MNDQVNYLLYNRLEFTLKLEVFCEGEKNYNYVHDNKYYMEVFLKISGLQHDVRFYVIRNALPDHLNLLEVSLNKSLINI